MRRPFHLSSLLCAALLLGTAARPALAQGTDQDPVTVRPFPEPPAAARPKVDTEDMFGFTYGADADEAGSWSLSLDTTTDIGARRGRYGTLLGKLEAEYGVTDTLSVSASLLAGWWDIGGVPDLDDRNVVRFQGIGTEVMWQLLQRGPSPVGLAVRVEPAWLVTDETSGAPGRGWGIENRIIMDAELLPARVWGAVNLVYDLQTFRAKGESTERSSVGGVSTAVSVQVVPRVFLGADLRYLRAYDGLGFERFRGQALFVGPTLYWEFSENATLTAAWVAQVAGRESDSDFALDLANFSRHQIRVKFKVSF